MTTTANRASTLSSDSADGDRAARKASSGRPPLASSSAASRASSSSSSQQPPSAQHAITKRHSLFGTEDRIVLDIGSRISKFGFSGEEKPRVILESVPLSQPQTSNPQDTGSADALWDPNIELVPNEQARRATQSLLLARLMQLLRSAFLQHLMVDPKQRKVLIIENASMPTLVKDVICKVLFSNLQVPSISFVPSHLVALVAVGKITGLVIECGYHETSIMPVYYGRPMVSHLRATSRAGRVLNRRLRALLLHHAKYLPSHASAAGSGSRSRTTEVPRAILTEDLIEHVKAKALLVESYQPEMDSLRASLIAETTSGTEPRVRAPDTSGLPASSSAAQSSFNPFASESEEPASLSQLYREMNRQSQEEAAYKTQALKSHYQRWSRATSMALALPTSRSNHAARTANASSSSFVADTTAAGMIAIPGWIRDRAAELLFEAEDDEELSVVELAVQVIRKLPIDMRKKLCENVVVTGGTAMLPGMINRLRIQLAAALRSGEQDGLGEHVAVLNDPWPQPSEASHVPQGGTAPAFAASMLPFIGASLLGELKTASLSEITREAYNEALLAAQKLQKGQEAQNRPEAGLSRPAVGPGNRGSFVGVVGGLETGAFGALAAVSRHLLIGNPQAHASVPFAS